MHSSRRLTKPLFGIVLSLLAATSIESSAFLVPPPTATVVEYHNEIINHYFLTAVPQEMAAVDSGLAGPGWSRTGHGFTAYALVGLNCGDCRAVSRFHGTPGLGPNSHFYTAHDEEAESLKSPGTGWDYEGPAFAISIPGSDARCVTGVPVYRLYNNRWMHNDSNHRYVTSQVERARMQALGWIDEGAKFCALAATEVPLRSFAFDPTLPGNVLPSAQCEDESLRTGSCIAVNNLPAPSSSRFLFGPAASMIANVTGTFALEVYVPDSWTGRLGEEPFVQNSAGTLGLHVGTGPRGASVYSSVNALYQFRTSRGDGASDARFFPFISSHGAEPELAIQFHVRVKRLHVASGSHAYGHPTLEFIDTRSGQHLYVTSLTYGTIQPADFVAPDVATGKTIVSVQLRSQGRSWIPTPHGFTSAEPAGTGGAFDLRLRRSEFEFLLGRARAVNAALSPNPDDYIIDNFHFNNEIVGDGEIGMNIRDFSLHLFRR